MFEGELWEILSKIGNLSLLVVVASALIYYFGKLIGDVQVEKHDKTDYYIKGLFFSLLYIGAPLAFVLYVRQFFSFYISPLISLILQIIILYFLSLNTLLNETLKRHRIPFKKIKEKILETYRPRLGKYLDEKIMENLNLILYELMRILRNDLFLILLSLIIIHICYSSVSFENLFSPISFFIITFTFLNYTALALSYGYAKANYPYVKILLKDGNEVEGRALKFGEFVCLLKENEEKRVLINKDSVVSIEISLYGEKETGVG